MMKCDKCEENVDDLGYRFWLIDEENKDIIYYFGHEKCIKEIEKENGF